jgi:hypothetical protein
MSENAVIVHATLFIVTTDQLSKTVWRATGTYMGETHQTQDRTESTAIKRWREWARFKRN